jgi:DNA-binding transcriptional MerR regulator
VKIGELAERSGVPAKAIRYYESIGVLPPPERAANGYRRYRPDALGRLAFIRRAQASGLTLAEVRTIVSFRARGEAPCTHVQALIDARATDIDRRIAELRTLRAELGALAARARNLDPVDCTPDAVCHILDPHPAHGEPTT